MKFLCPSCKAKYQIADEKVIGRTVKMKCRQCGYVIEINEAVIGDLGLSSAPPPRVAEAPQSGEAEASGSASLKRPPPKPARSATPPDGIAAPTSVAPVPPAPSPTGPKAAMARPTAPHAAPLRSATPRSDPQSPAAPGGSRPTAPSAAKRTGTSGALPAVRPATPASSPENSRPSAVPVPRPAPAKFTPTPFVKPVHLDPRRLGASPAERGADRNLDSSARESAPPASQRAVQPATADAVIPARRAPAVGRLPGVPETVVSSLGVSATRPALAQQDPLAGAFTRAVAGSAEATEPAEHPLAGDEWYVGVNDQPIGPIRLAEIRDRAANGEITPECLVWRDGFEDWKPLTAFPELIAVVEEGVASYRSLRPPPPSAPTSSEAQAAPSSVEQPRLAPTRPMVSVPPDSGVDNEALVVPGLSKPKIPLSAWLAVVMALALGVTIGLVVLKPEPPKQIIKYVEVPASPKQQVGDAPPPAPADNGALVNGAPGETVPASDKRVGVAAKKPTANGGVEAPAAGASAEAPQGLKGLQGLQGLGAPRTGPAGEVAASAAGRQQLDSATLSRTVSRYTASVKRSCWQPALDTRAPDAATSARISANIVVASSGKVQNVSVSPDPKGYHGLSTCIQSRVRTWEFPPAGGSTEFNVPFVFAAQ